MARIIKKFQNGRSHLEYDKGSFDNWCIYLVYPSGKRKPAIDKNYFTSLKELSERYGKEKIYWDFVSIYEHTKKQVEENVLKMITDIASGYDSDALKLDVIFSILYMGMIAEEHVKNTHLGKRIKRLGMHSLLIEGKTPEYSADFMRNKPWRLIDTWCLERGF